MTLSLDQLRSALHGPTVIPACPLALTAQRKLDERRQRALVRYYLAAGATGLAVGVHTTQFAIRDPQIGLYRPVLDLAAAEMGRADRPVIRIAGVCGPTPQALAEAELARGLGYHAALLSLGALLAEVAHTRPVRLVGGASDPELAARLGLRPTRYEGPTGIVGVLNTMCREAGISAANLWANVPHYVSGIENPKAALALIRRVLSLLNGSLDLADLEDAVRQFEQNLAEIVAQNGKIAAYIAKLETREAEEAPGDAAESDLPPASQLVAEIEQFLKQQRPE